MINIDILIYCFLYIVIGIIFVMFFIKKSKEFSPAYKGFMFGMLFYYVIIPIIVLLNVEGLNNVELAKGKYCTYSVQRFVIDGESWKKLYSILMLAIVFIFFNLFYHFAKKIKIGKFNPEKTLRIVKIITYVTFFVGGISLIIFFISFGGIGKALHYAEYLRGFNTQLDDININTGMFLFLGKLIIVAPFTLLYLISNDKLGNKKKYISMLVVSIIMSILYFLFNAGRAPLLFFILCFVYFAICKKVKIPWGVIIGLSICALPMLDILDSLFYYFNTGTFNLKEINYLKYISQFTFPYKNTLIITDLVDQYGLRYGLDFVTAFLDLLPKISFEASYANTSEFIAGIEWRNLGGIPNDFITFTYIQGSFVGVIFLSSIMGILLRTIDRKLANFKENGAKYLITAAISVYSFSLIPYADFVSFIKGSFILITLTFIILISDRK